MISSMTVGGEPSNEDILKELRALREEVAFLKDQVIGHFGGVWLNTGGGLKIDMTRSVDTQPIEAPTNYWGDWFGVVGKKLYDVAE